MKHRETLDEAIDRVAAQMSADGEWQGVDRPELPPRGFIADWGPWRWAVVAAGALFLATALVIFGPDRRNAEVETAQSVQPSEGESSRDEGRPGRRGEDPPVAARVPPQGADVVSIAPRQVPPRASRARAAAQPAPTQQVSADPFEAVEGPLSSIEAPARLDVAGMEIPALHVDENKRIEPLIVPDLVIDTSSESPFTRE